MNGSLRFVGGLMLAALCSCGGAAATSPQSAGTSGVATSSAGSHELESKSADTEEQKTGGAKRSTVADGPCPSAPDRKEILRWVEEARLQAREADEFLRSMGLPPRPTAPYTVERARAWSEKQAQPWVDRQAREIEKYEEELAALPKGSYGRARMLVTVAALWKYLSGRRPSLPKSAEKDYGVRVAYFVEFARYQGKPLHEHAERWVKLARKEASSWGMFQIGVERFWLTGDSHRLLREPFVPVDYGQGADLPVAPRSVRQEMSQPTWPASADEVARLGQNGMTPRQLTCALRFRDEPAARHSLGRYFASRAILFQDQEAASEAMRLLDGDPLPAAVVDRVTVALLFAHGSSERDKLIRTVRAQYAALEPGHLSRLRLWVNSYFGGVSLSSVLEERPPLERLPAAERPVKSRTVEPQIVYGAPPQKFPWFTPHRANVRDRGGNRRVEGLQMDLDDGSHVFIPYTDQGLDRCAMELVSRDGQRMPHRPPGMQRKCSVSWAKQDARE